MKHLSLFATCAFAALTVTAQTSSTSQPDLTRLRGLRIGATCAELIELYRAESVAQARITDPKRVAERAISLNCARNQYTVPTPSYDDSEGFRHLAFHSDGSRTVIQYGKDGRAWQIKNSITYGENLAQKTGPAAGVFFDEVFRRFGPPPLVNDPNIGPRARELARFQPPLDKKEGFTSAFAFWGSEGAPWKGTINYADELDLSCFQFGADTPEANRAQRECFRPGLELFERRRASLKGYIIEMFVFSKHSIVTTVDVELYDPAIKSQVKAAVQGKERATETNKIPRW